MEEPTTNSLNQNCKNCTHPISDSAKYCSNCGQKNTDGRISIGSFFAAFFSTVFNLESKFFQTMGHIFIPGKLTVEYFKGKHKRYFHPVRFFIVTALLLIAVFGYQLTENSMSFPDIRKKAEKTIYKKKFLAEMDSLGHITSKKFPTEANVKPAFDSLYHLMKGNYLAEKDSINLNSLMIIGGGFDKINYKVANEDFLNLSPKELLDKYKVEGKLDRLIFQQKIKLLKARGTFASFLLGNSVWIILLLMPLLGLILKILYIRHHYYYVEHLVFSFHTHAFAFLLFGIIIFIVFQFAVYWLIGISFIILFFYLFLALRKVYGQGRIKTFIKLLILNFVYFFLAIFCTIIGFAISIATF